MKQEFNRSEVYLNVTSYFESVESQLLKLSCDSYISGIYLTCVLAFLTVTPAKLLNSFNILVLSL